MYAAAMSLCTEDTGSFSLRPAGRIDWLWLHSLLHAQKHGPVLRVELQSGPPNGLLPARYECIDRLFAQVNERRRILLIPPSQVRKRANA